MGFHNAHHKLIAIVNIGDLLCKAMRLFSHLSLYICLYVFDVKHGITYINGTWHYYYYYGIVLLTVYIKSLKLIARTLFALLLIPTAIKKNYLRMFCAKRKMLKIYYKFKKKNSQTKVEINVQQFVDYYSRNKYSVWFKCFKGFLIA